MTTARPPLYRSRPSGFEILPATHEAAIPINDFIYLSPGLSNSFLIVTDGGRIVVNTGMAFESPTHKAVYDAVDDGPVRYIILTQGHIDHIGGIDLFREDGTEVVAQANNPAHLLDDARIAGFRGARSAFAFANAIQTAVEHAKKHPEREQAMASGEPWPTRTFEDRDTLELGGLEIELLSVPGGETRDSLAIWLPQHRICFAGNLFSALFGHFPNLVTIRGDRYREAPEFIASLERILALEPELLLVGHHDPIEGRDLIREELLRLRGAVQYVYDETLEGMNSGVDVRTLMREIQLPEELEVGQGYGKVAWSVRAIWETYAGWFHHESTTELYGVPPSSVHPDLLELAGPDEVAARARERAAAGDYLEAIYLAEVILSQDPNHRSALQACIAAHEGLIEQSINFWETSWLRKQVASMQASLKES